MFFSFFETMLLIPIITVGILCVFTDLKNKKIHNKVILFGFGYGFIVFLFFAFNQCSEFDLIKALINFIVSVFVSYFLWVYNFWSAGDAKLFCLFSFLLPLTFYEKANYPIFPSFNILITLFILIIIFLLFLSIFNFLKEKEKKANIKLFVNHMINFFKFSFIYVFLFLIFQKLFVIFDGGGLKFEITYVVFIFLTIRIVRKFLSTRFFLNYIIIFLTIAYSFFLFFSGQEELLQNIFLKVYVFLGIIFLIRVLIDSYIDKCEIKDVKIKDLRKGMLVILDNKEVKKITDDEINKMKNFYEKNDSIKTYNDFPFSLFIFVAIIITIFLRSSLLIFIF